MSQPGPLRHGGRLEIRVGPSDVGQRVSVRHHLPATNDTPGDPQFTDIVGELLSWGAEEVCIRRRTGEEVCVPLRLIVAAKTIPPASTPRAR